MPVSPQTQAGLGQSEQAGLTEEQRVAIDFRNTLPDVVAVLEGVGPLCTDIDELIQMLEMAMKNDAQLLLIMHHMSPKRMRPLGK